MSEITTPLSDESKGVFEWVATSGSGLVRTTAFIPRPLDELSMEWKKRGRHSAGDIEACDGCHALENGVVGHTLSLYSDDALAGLYQGGANCALSCHPWLSENVSSAGRYSGTMRPEALLKNEGSHSDIFRKGFTGDPESKTLKTSFLPPGCGACHNHTITRHGSVPSCLDCHSFVNVSVFAVGDFSELHDSHAGRAEDSCAYCHVSGDSADEQTRAVCYNCHLSGHNPGIY